MQDLVRQWKAKPLHGRYRSRIEDNAIDTKASQGWLQSGNLFLETEGFIASIQDQTETDELKREVGRAISQNAINDEVAPTRLSVLDQPHIEPECVTSQKQKELNDLFLSTLSFYRFSDPTKRPRLPKLLLNAKSNQIIHQMDEILLRHLEHCDDLEEVHLSIYAAAATVVNVNGQKLLPPNDAPLKKTSKRSEEPWKLRLMKDIDSCRAEADLISEYQGGNRSRKVIKKIADIKRKINVPPSCDIDSSFLNLHRDKMRQEAKMKGARLQRYNETSKRKQQNALFERNQNQFYRSIIPESSSEPKGIRDTQNFVKFWSDIWSEPKPSDLNAPWIKEVVKAAKVNPMSVAIFSQDDVSRVLKNAADWKAPGPDNIQNFWLKKFLSTHAALGRSLSKAITNPEILPNFLTKGITHIIFKNGNPEDPKNSRPITCLSVFYKLLTALLNDQIYTHCESNNIIATEQKGCVRGSFGCKEQLIIDSVITKHACKNKRNLHVCYIDYSKAFDSVPHNWLLKVLDIYKVDIRIINLLSHLMMNWEPL
ncbi:unnamed protein product [Acanthoscelides obtectus]|uniref:Reverse transcriptase domain-containing protein n=1 Tax=Acanthoscelides obtectus TaxID=200917 RepID=A0A9P0VRJ8_ACAOB|nr:unnamed protein product [Acanthoscelides obtectus]CAK1687836.1 hypothetical protein AOBTE_LOCUS36400 [Acanthoscelides obtectus]